MALDETLAIALKVLSDWRVLAIAAAFLLLLATLRYVGSVYRKRAPRRVLPAVPDSSKAPAEGNAPSTAGGARPQVEPGD